MDYSIGSTLECAACLDLARIKELLDPNSLPQHKEKLAEIVRMLYGLRKAWDNLAAHEQPGTYSAKTAKDLAGPLFNHERLDVYQVALSFMQWFVAQPQGRELSSRLFRRVDEAATSIVLNIAEGNGRFAELDHTRFLQMGRSAAVKAAVYLDIAASRGGMKPGETVAGKKLLQRISDMIAGF